jgi:hypothetical protein
MIFHQDQQNHHLSQIYNQGHFLTKMSLLTTINHHNKSIITQNHYCFTLSNIMRFILNHIVERLKFRVSKMKQNRFFWKNVSPFKQTNQNRVIPTTFKMKPDTSSTTYSYSQTTLPLFWKNVSH